MVKRIFTAAAAAALAVAPTVASAQQAAPAVPAPAQESVEGSQIRGGFILPLVLVVALAVLIYLLTHDDEDGGVPVSP